MIMKPALLDSIVFNVLVKTCTRQSHPLVRPWWRRVHSAFSERRRVVQTKIHGQSTMLNFGYTDPVVARLHRSFNAPLLELVSTIHRLRGRPIRLADIGAAIGDTILLVEGNCPGVVSEYICIDGDAEFSNYIKANLAHLPNVRCVFQQLSRDEGYNAELIRTHSGTASAQGNGQVPTAPLDEVLRQIQVEAIDLLKVDVDGFDGEVLAGGEEVLQRDQPGVIFEWHPTLCKQTRNDPLVAFEVLRKNGYSRAAWFTKFGAFSHFSSLDDVASLSALAQFCVSTTQFEDWHFDVVALADRDSHALGDLADLRSARDRISPW